jgi:hypothetical protein
LLYAKKLYTGVIFLKGRIRFSDEFLPLSVGASDGMQ